MTRPARSILTAILLLSVLLRVGVALYLGDGIEDIRGGTHDQISYDALAQRVAGGHGFSFATDWWPGVATNEPTAFWSYLYTLYLAGVYLVAGHHPLAARLIQAVAVGIAMPWLLYRIGRRTFGPRAALLGAAVAAIYAYFIDYAASLMTESFYIVGILWTLDAGMRLAAAFDNPQAPGDRRWRLGLELGLAMGLTLLLRQVILAFFAFLAGWLVWAGARRARRAPAQMLMVLAVSGLVALACMAPFIARNGRVFGRLTLPNTNAGFTFFWANHPIYGTRFEAVLSPEHGVSYQDLIPPELRGLNEADLDRALLRRGVQFVVDDPGRYLRLSLSRIPVYFQFWPTSTSTPLSNAARAASFGLFLPFMLYGVALAVAGPRRSRGALAAWGVAGERPPLYTARVALLLSFVVVYAAIHLASWANVRYRLPVDAVLVLFAGVALDDLARRWVRARAGGAPAGVTESADGR